MESQGKQLHKVVQTANNVGNWQGVLEPDVQGMDERSLQGRATSEVLEGRVNVLRESLATMASKVREFNVAVVEEIQRMRSQIARLESEVEVLKAKSNVDTVE